MVEQVTASLQRVKIERVIWRFDKFTTAAFSTIDRMHLVWVAFFHETGKVEISVNLDKMNIEQAGWAQIAIRMAQSWAVEELAKRDAEKEKPLLIVKRELKYIYAET